MDNSKQHIMTYLKNNIRYDGRKNDQYREVKVETGITTTAEGSARVQMGDTIVLAGVKFELGQPYPDTPDEGTMMVNAELIPMSSPDFEAGPPGNDSIELARVVDRGIRESKAIDTKKLCLVPGEKVWTVVVDLVPLNADGNLFDASALAMGLALKDARFPKIVDDKIDYKQLTNDKLPLKELPVSVTVWKIGNDLIIDPISVEEKIFDSRLTVATLSDGTICALQKGGEAPLTLDEIDKMLDLATEKAKELRKFIKG